MARILDLFLARKTDQSCSKFPTQQLLFEGLAAENEAAIRCLSSRVSGSVFKIGKVNGLPDEDIEELICDCLTLFLQKIRGGKYVFQGFDPATFVIETAKNNARNFRRSRIRHHSIGLESVGEPANETDFGKLVETELLEKLIAQLNPNCQRLVILKYLEERRDKEIIDLKLTQYSTVDALKNQRAQCMKKLTELAQSSALLKLNRLS